MMQQKVVEFQPNISLYALYGSTGTIIRAIAQIIPTASFAEGNYTYI